MPLELIPSEPRTKIDSLHNELGYTATLSHAPVTDNRVREVTSLSPTDGGLRG